MRGSPNNISLINDSCTLHMPLQWKLCTDENAAYVNIRRQRRVCWGNAENFGVELRKKTG